MENIYNYFLKLISFRSDNKQFENIEIFNGGYHDGFFTGKGKVNLNDGSVYEGEFTKSKMNGYGKIDECLIKTFVGSKRRKSN